MRFAQLIFTLVLVTGPALAQNSADQAGTQTNQERQGNDMQGSESMHEMRGMQGMRGKGCMKDEMMKRMQAGLETLHTNLQKMKDHAGKVSDPQRKEDIQLNIDMWQSLVDHMDEHMANRHAMMHSKHGMMPCKMDMKGGSPPNP